ncbi:hypothetical protein GCM10020220_023120 [Nonomuraea rubra]
MRRPTVPGGAPLLEITFAMHAARHSGRDPLGIAPPCAYIRVHAGPLSDTRDPPYRTPQQLRRALPRSSYRPSICTAQPDRTPLARHAPTALLVWHKHLRLSLSSGTRTPIALPLAIDPLPALHYDTKTATLTPPCLTTPSLDNTLPSTPNSPDALGYPPHAPSCGPLTYHPVPPDHQRP